MNSPTDLREVAYPDTRSELLAIINSRLLVLGKSGEDFERRLEQHKINTAEATQLRTAAAALQKEASRAE